MIGWLLMLGGLLIAAAAAAVAATRAAYRDGVNDGWSARHAPNDALWREKVKPIIDRQRPWAWDEALGCRARLAELERWRAEYLHSPCHEHGCSAITLRRRVAELEAEIAAAREAPR